MRRFLPSLLLAVLGAAAPAAAQQHAAGDTLAGRRIHMAVDSIEVNPKLNLRSKRWLLRLDSLADTLTRRAAQAYRVDTVRVVRVDTVYATKPDTSTPPIDSAIAASVAIHATASSVAVGAQLQLSTEVRNAAGAEVVRVVKWSIDSSAVAIADLSGAGLLSGKAAGSVTVTARADAVVATRTFTVTGSPPPPPPPPVDTAPPVATAFPVPAGLGLALAAIAELPRDTVPTPYPTSTSTVRVAAGADLQAALNASTAGGVTILLAPGSVFTGEYMLPKHAGAAAASCSSWNVLRTDLTDAQLGAPGVRMTPSRAAALKLAKLQAPGNQQAIGDAWGVANIGCWRLVGLEVLPSPTGANINGLVRFGDYNATDSTKQSHHLVLDRSYVHGVQQIPAGVTPTVQAWPGSVRRCVAFNSRFNVVVDSWLEWCRGGNGDAQAILAYSGTGPYRVSNSHVSGGTEVIMFGGATSGIVGAVPSDVTLHGNVITRELADTLTLVKNLLETKNVERLDAAGNIYRFNWPNGQVGYAILLKSVNQSSGPCSWCRSRHITLRYSRLVSSDNGFNLAGIQEGPAQSAGPYTIYHFQLDSLGFRDNEGPRPIQILGGSPMSLFDVTLDHITMPATSWGAVTWEGAVARIAFSNSVLFCGGYGFKGAGLQQGMNTLSALGTPYAWSGNIMHGCSSGYPAGSSYSTWPVTSTSAGAQLGTILDRVEVPR